ncbi:hypothetical protein Y032_0765g2160 [Ancylostoma ceylanicum]|uniref:Uncharacterized protein n=1 Tax=Ancylostoma ceylanicum TaxID=53326 RepID=A0A016WDU0_9BILA|nr:hypothetical protein Y032_0765g2160 [Ancylostoma ceylanicum]
MQCFWKYFRFSPRSLHCIWVKFHFILDVNACFATEVSMSGFSPKGRAKIVNRSRKMVRKRIHADSKDNISSCGFFYRFVLLTGNQILIGKLRGLLYNQDSLE